MTPAARLQAAAEILDQIAAGRAPAEAVLKSWGAAHRYAGSKDRRAIADRVYLCLRQRARLAWAGGGEDGRTLVLLSLALSDGLEPPEIEALYSGQGYGPASLSEAERARLTAPPGEPPAWVAAGLPAFAADDLRAQYGEGWPVEAEALLRPRAPIDLRVNGALASRIAVLAELHAEGLAAEPAPYSAWGLRLPSEPPPNVQKLAAFREGRLEIQDEGSQLAAWLAGTGELVVDYCAGGGGKTLALRQSAPAARLVACDVEPKRLE
ncbi:MAG: RsmB/NOP family class I SAM-dependent RNA methyltransferase, partial [Pseudomonadota bacterium]|nr:RsmB/NOP family class I SAM-dependent RNA methyltransferase [Pseudomonadota bacterium]